MLTSTLDSPSVALERTGAPVTLYGRHWCAYSRLARARLDRLCIPYDYVDLDAHPEQERRLATITGRHVYSPVVDVGEQLLLQPDPGELSWALRCAGW